MPFGALACEQIGPSALVVPLRVPGRCPVGVGPGVLGVQLHGRGEVGDGIVVLPPKPAKPEPKRISADYKRCVQSGWSRKAHSVVHEALGLVIKGNH